MFVVVRFVNILLTSVVDCLEALLLVITMEIMVIAVYS